jgi:hypothetical protein
MSGGSDKASKEAQRQEAARQAAIKNTQAAINAVFSDPSRAADIADAVEANRQYLTGDLNEQKANADRNLKFALARGGMLGGSVQTDKQRILGQDYSKGLLDIQRKSAGFGAQLESADQDARAKLISLATTGLDTTTGASMAASALRSNLESGSSEAQLSSLSDAFSNLGDFWKKSQDDALRRKADRQAYGLYTPNANFSGAYGGGP